MATSRMKREEARVHYETFDDNEEETVNNGDITTASDKRGRPYLDADTHCSNKNSPENFNPSLYYEKISNLTFLATFSNYIIINIMKHFQPKVNSLMCLCKVGASISKTLRLSSLAIIYVC